MSHKAQKMCKSPKSINYSQSDKIEYENLNTNCTIVGSNNLHLVKKPQIVTSMSPAYSNPSPGTVGYPPSPYSSPASLKSPSPQLNLKPPTPQPNTFPVMQIIHNSHPVIAARPIHTQQQQNVIKLKPLNILPKPSASPQQSPKPSVSPQIVLPTNQPATIMPTGQPLLLNQIPMLPPNVQFVFRPQTTKLPAQVQQAPQGLILQPSGQQLLQLQPPRSQPMMRVLTNGMALPTTTYVTHMTPQNSVQQQSIVSQMPQMSPKKKPKQKKKQKLDLANIMKLSGIGDDDDVQFESDSQSESEHNAHSQPVTPQPAPTTPTATIMQPAGQMVQGSNVVQQSVIQNDNKSAQKVGNIQISAVPQTINTAGAPLVQVLNQTFQGNTQNAQPQTFNSFIAPNFTINNGLMVQRSGGFKLALGEDGRFVIQHDPTLNQDLQAQFVLQSLLGLNGGLVLQPSIDQQIHSQTVQTIQQQSVQTIQQQTVQSQTIQTVQHQIVQPQTLQTIQSQLQGQLQSLLQQQNIGSQSIAIQPQNITLQPQSLQGIQVTQPISIQSQQAQNQPITIQSQNIQAQSHQSSTQSQLINLSQPIFTQNNQSQNIMQIQGIQQSQHLTQTTQSHSSVKSQSEIMQQQQQPPQNFTQSTNLHNHPITTQTHSTIGGQPVLKVQPFQKTQPPVQTVHPIHHNSQHTQAQQQQQQPPPPTSYVVNLTPDQLEQLKRNGQLTVNGQTIFMQRPKNEDVKKTSPKIKPIKKASKIPTAIKDKSTNNLDKTINNVVKESVKSTAIPNKLPISQSIQSIQSQVVKPQPSAIIQPSFQSQTNQQKTQTTQPKVHVTPQIQQPIQISNSSSANNQDVERFLGQLMEDNQEANENIPTNPPSSNSIVINTPACIPSNPNQRVIQLTPQKQQHLKSIQLQIQTLSARLTPGNVEMQNALKRLFQEQQNILASGKLLPADKVFYHNNQLIVNNSLIKNDVLTPTSKTQVNPSIVNGPTETAPPISNQQHQINIPQALPIPKINPNLATSTAESVQTSTVPVQKVAPIVPVTTQPKPAQVRYLPTYTKAKLIEQQQNTDQSGALKPDIQTPFKDKADACKRLIRYHCFEQPVLSQKDLNKADEIFELTARHFIDKFGRMVDKYRYLLHKESQRHVQTSELMMLDRMFLAEEQQSLIKLRQEMEESNLEIQQASYDHQGNLEEKLQNESRNSDEYDEWACIQRELGCLPSSEESKSPGASTSTTTTSTNTSTNVLNSNQSNKRCLSNDTRLETLKRFRVDKPVKRESPEVTRSSMRINAQHSNAIQNNVFSNINPVTQCSNVQTSSYSTNISESSSPQRTLHSCSRSAVNSTCSITTTRTSNSGYNNNCSAPLSHSEPVMNINQSISSSMPQMLQNYNTAMQMPSSIQRAHGNAVHSNVHHQNVHPLQHVMHNSSTQQALLHRGVHNMQHYSTQHIVQHITHTVHHTQQMHSEGSSIHSQNSMHHSSSVHSQNSYSSGNEELDNNDSIDEQVQSAIDSILNLQQNTSLELDETMQNMLS